MPKTLLKSLKYIRKLKSPMLTLVTVVYEIIQLDQPSPHETVHQNVYQSPSREEMVHLE